MLRTKTVLRSSATRTFQVWRVSLTRGFSIVNDGSNAGTKSNTKPKVVIVGAGWAGYRAALDIDKKKFDVNVVSPRNHFLFTPLLPSTAVGTLEFRCIQEPVRTIPNIQYFQASVTGFDFHNQVLHCHDAFKEGFDFAMKYDTLILAPGSETNTLGVQGVENNPNVFFLKQLNHARAIRNRLIDCFERASSPAVKSDEKLIKSLLTFVVVGGGPTSVELAAEIYDFLKKDVSRWYPDLYPIARVMIIEATGYILGSFNHSLVSYVENLFKTRNIHLLTSTQVKEVRDHIAYLSDGTEVDFGLMVWSTGIRQVPLIQQIPSEQVQKFPNGRLKTDSRLRLLFADPSIKLGSVLALGDCAGHSTKPLPALAQVASQQANYIAEVINQYGIDGIWKSDKFTYSHLGSMASVGDWKGVYDSPSFDGPVEAPPVQGLIAFLLYRAAYWTKQVSVTNKILIPMYWLKAMIFGRDISRF